MNNNRISAKERGILKGAIRRAFSRSDLRRSVIAFSFIEHTDPARPRVKKWSKCALCKKPVPSYKLEVDHVIPIVPVDKTLEDMTWDEVVDRVFCAANNLQAICEVCHDEKTKIERAERKKHKDKKKKG